MWEKNLEIMPRKKLKSYTSSKAEPLVSLREQAPVSDKARAAIARATESFFHDSSESNDKFEASLSRMETILSRFQEALSLPHNETDRDSSILRFELSAELVWKTLKAYLKEKKAVEVSSPMDAVREAFKQGLINDEPFWTSTVKLRNQVVHTYREDLAEEIYAALPRILSLYKNLLETLKRKVNE